MTETAIPPPPPPAPRSMRLVAMVVCSAVGLSAAVVGVLSLLQPRPSWVLFGFELVVLVSAILGFQIGRGRHRDGPALGLLCIAGAVAVGSGFGYLGGGRVLFLPSLGFEHELSLRPLLYARALGGLVLAAAAAWVVLARDPRATIPPLIRGCAFALPIPVLLVLAARLRPKVAALSDVVQLGLALVVFAMITGLLAASVQYLVKAFDLGIRRGDELSGARPTV